MAPLDRALVSSYRNHWASITTKNIKLDYVSDDQLASACKDAPCIAPSRVTEKIFAVLMD